MNMLVATLMAIMLAYAFKRKNAAGELAWWRLVAAVSSGIFPHVQEFLILFGRSTYERHMFAETYSLFLWPLWALGLAWLVGRVSQKNWQSFYLVCLVGVGINILLTLLSTEGVRLFAPVFDWRVSLNLIYKFDLVLLAISTITVGLTMVIRAWRRDIARVGVVVSLAYLVVLMTFQGKANAFAHNYIDALGLQVKKVYVQAQPVSPMNWRVIIQTKQDHLHDTRIHLFRKEPLKTDDQSTRAWRVFSTYAPMDQAVWGIYRRLGRPTPQAHDMLQETWQKMRKAGFNWHLRFVVFQQAVRVGEQACTKWRDLRRFGTRNENIGVYIACAEKDNSLTLYQAEARSGKLSRLERIY